MCAAALSVARDVPLAFHASSDDDLGLRSCSRGDATHTLTPSITGMEIEGADVRPIPIEGRDGVGAINGGRDAVRLVTMLARRCGKERVIVRLSAPGNRPRDGGPPLATALR
jgi:hypothetical protein